MPATLVGYRSRCYDASMRTKITNLPVGVLRKLSAITGISYDMLRHYASGRRGMKSLTAIKIERGALQAAHRSAPRGSQRRLRPVRVRTGLPQVSGTDEDSREVTTWYTGP